MGTGTLGWRIQRLLIPFVLFLSAALLFANLWVGSGRIALGQSDFHGDLGDEHEHLACLSEAGELRVLKLHFGQQLGNTETTRCRTPTAAGTAGETLATVRIKHTGAFH